MQFTCISTHSHCHTYMQMKCYSDSYFAGCSILLVPCGHTNMQLWVLSGVWFPSLCLWMSYYVHSCSFSLSDVYTCTLPCIVELHYTCYQHAVYHIFLSFDWCAVPHCILMNRFGQNQLTSLCALLSFNRFVVLHYKLGFAVDYQPVDSSIVILLTKVLLYVHYLQLKLLQGALIFERLRHSRDQILKIE